MSWWSSILCGLISGALGGVCSALVSVFATRWHNVSTREGERAFTVIYLVLLGIVVGSILGIVISRSLADRPGASLSTALGWSSATLGTIAAVAFLLSWLSGSPAAPTALELEFSNQKPRAEPQEEARDPREEYAKQRMTELRAFSVETPLYAWLAYSRGNDAEEVKRFALRSISARPHLIADLNELLDSQGCTAALHYIEDEMKDVPVELLPGIHAAMMQIPELLKRSFSDSSGVRADSGLFDVRLALAVLDKLGAERKSFRPDVELLAKTFSEAPRVRRVSRGSRYVEEEIKTFDGERLLKAWLK